ncbi:MAG: hypothetical protein ACK55I_30210 [bacterium]|jgi:hypothetical protein
MKEPTKIPLTNNPRSKEPNKQSLSTPNHYDIDMRDDIWIKNENNIQDNSESISELESYETD